MTTEAAVRAIVLEEIDRSVSPLLARAPGVAAPLLEADGPKPVDVSSLCWNWVEHAWCAGRVYRRKGGWLPCACRCHAP